MNAARRIVYRPDHSARVHSACLLTLLLTLMLGACSETIEYAALPAGSPVLAFGDSVTYGTGAQRGEDYPSQLAARSRWNVINAGIPGDTAREARQRLGRLLHQHEPVLVIIELGGNDFLRKRPESQVASDLAAMITEVEEFGALPVLVAVPRLSLLRASTGTLRDSHIYAELEQQTGALLVPDLFSDILPDSSLKADEIHPNAAGYQVLADGIADRLRETGLLKP